MKNIITTTKICVLAAVVCALGTATAAVDREANRAAAAAMQAALNALGPNPDPATIQETVAQVAQTHIAQLAANFPDDEEAHAAMAKALMQGAGIGLFSIIERNPSIWAGTGPEGSSHAMHAVKNGMAQGSMAGAPNMVYAHAYGKAAGFASSYLHTGRTQDREVFITANAHMITNAFLNAGAPESGTFNGQQTTLAQVVTQALTSVLGSAGYTGSVMSNEAHVTTRPDPVPVTDVLGQ
jgi:hypothetical protein